MTEQLNSNKICVTSRTIILRCKIGIYIGGALLDSMELKIIKIKIILKNFLII